MDGSGPSSLGRDPISLPDPPPGTRTRAKKHENSINITQRTYVEDLTRRLRREFSISVSLLVYLEPFFKGLLTGQDGQKRQF